MLPASAVPLMLTPDVFSVGPITLSPATFAITGAAGGVVSICTVLVAGSLETPAVDFTIALIVVPGASAGTSALVKLADQRPALSAVTVLDVLPQLTVTLALASAIPVTATPAVAPFSAALTLSSLATTLITGVAGLTFVVVPVPVPVVGAAAAPPPPPPRTPPNTPPTNGVPTASQVFNPPPEDGAATGDVPTA